MNGAHALIDTLVGAGVEVCFANPGTSEMHFVAALDDVPGMRVVLGLFEGVVTGAADGYARISGRPAATLLHCGPGMANGMANLHNARRARVPMVNIVGDHATYHARYDAPLSSDITTVAQTFSGWTRRLETSGEIGPAVAAAVAASLSAPNSISTLILPADVSWGEGATVALPEPAPEPEPVTSATIDSVARLLRSGARCSLLLGGSAVRAEALTTASAVADATAAGLLLETALTRAERGGGLPVIERLNYRADAAVKQLDGTEHLILVDAKAPVAFFAYPDKPSDLVPDGCQVHVLSPIGTRADTALAALADALGAATPASTPVQRPPRPRGALTPQSVAQAIAALLPEDAIVIDESVTSGGYILAATARGPRHDWLNDMGGAIGVGLPLAIGAAIAAPDRKVVGLQADGSSMYTIQALWTHAREQIDATTIVLNNRRYSILQSELGRVGANEGPKARDMLELSRPDLDFVALANGLGVEAERASTAEKFSAALERALTADGPRLVEAVI